RKSSLQCKHLRCVCGGFIVSKIKRNQYRKPGRNGGTKSSRKKNQNREEGRRIFSESVEENPTEEDLILNRPFCIHSISPLAVVWTLAKVMGVCFAFSGRFNPFSISHL